MDKVVEFIKKNKVKVAGAFIMIAAFVILLIINLHVDYTSDDFRYRFIRYPRESSANDKKDFKSLGCNYFND